MEKSEERFHQESVIPPQNTFSSKHLFTTIVIAGVSAIFASGGTYLVMSSQQDIQQTQTSYKQPTPSQFQPTETPDATTAPISVVTIQPSITIISSKNSSPDGSYTVTEKMLGDYNTITVKDSKGTVIVDDLVAKNESEIGMGEKYGCQCGVHFKGWSSSQEFVLQVLNGAGEEYEFLVDAMIGKVNEASFRRIK